MPDKCPVCGHADAKFVRSERSHAIFHCVSCGVYYVHPLPAGEGLGYFPDPDWSTRVRARAEAIYLDGLMSLEGLCGSLPRRLADVGCGFGLFVELAVRRGWEALGMDPDAMAIRYGSESLGIPNLIHGDLISVGFPPASFSVVTMWNVLEHVTDPVANVREAHRVLSPDGILLVRVPNMFPFEMALTIAKFIPIPRLRRLSFLGGVSPPQHLYGFTASALRHLLEHQGFDVIRIEPAMARHTLSNRSYLLVSILFNVSRSLYKASAHRMVIFPTMVAFARKVRETAFSLPDSKAG